VLKDPEPLVYFLNFGQSTLDHELRMHVRDLGDRNPVIDEVNRFINREFKNHSINISFQQMEVYLKNLHGQEYKLVPIGPEVPPAPNIARLARLAAATGQARRAQNPVSAQSRDRARRDLLKTGGPAPRPQQRCSDSFMWETAIESPRRTDLRQPLCSPGRRVFDPRPARAHRRATRGSGQPVGHGAA
jgi:hypothetical protein